MTRHTFRFGRPIFKHTIMTSNRWVRDHMAGSGGREIAQRTSWWLQGATGCQLRTILEKKFILGISPTKWWVTIFKREIFEIWNFNLWLQVSQVNPPLSQVSPMKRHHLWTSISLYTGIWLPPQEHHSTITQERQAMGKWRTRGRRTKIYL